MNDNIRLAREIIAIAQELVEDNENEGQEIWKLMRVLNNGGREVISCKLTFDIDSTDDEKIEAMERQIKKTGWKFPPDCHTYTEKNQFVVKNNNGTVEWRMFKTSDGDRAKGRMHRWYIKKMCENYPEPYTKTFLCSDNSTTSDKLDIIISYLGHNHIFVRRQNIVIKPNEILIYIHGKLAYIFERKK